MMLMTVIHRHPRLVWPAGVGSLVLFLAGLFLLA